MYISNIDRVVFLSMHEALLSRVIALSEQQFAYLSETTLIMGSHYPLPHKLL